MIDFPDYALILAEGYAEEPDYGLVRTEMDGGIAKQRRRFSVPVISRSVTVKVISDADRARFDAWFRRDANGGASWFNWLDPVDGVRKRARVTGTRPPYRWQREGVGRWQAQLQIETIG